MHTQNNSTNIYQPVTAPPIECQVQYLKSAIIFANWQKFAKIVLFAFILQL